MNKHSQGMSRGIVLILMLIAFVAGAGVGIGGFIYVTGGDGRPSRDVSEVITQTDLQATDVSTDTTETETDASNETVDTAQNAGETVAFTIDAEQSQASFTIHEDLQGVPTTVVGTTTEVGGTIQVNFENLSASTISTIAVNARTLATDSDMRNRAIRSRILQSAEDAYEFIIFTPTALSNFSANSVSVGDTINFDIIGDLTVKTVTKSVTFKATVTLVSETQINGTATTTVLYPDFALTIPNAPGVANVTEEVDLQLDFVALAQ